VNIVIRISLAILLVTELVVGFWNQVVPASFYNNFPTVDANPPYSEHFARDFGGATLGIALFLAIAVVSPRAVFVIPATLGYSVYSIPHFFFHLTHIDAISTPEAIGLTTANALGALLGLTTIVLSWATRSLRPGTIADTPNVSSTTP
jgi:hypothetical protein